MKKKVMPKVKTKVEEFLLGEDGKVSKSSILKTGLMVAAASVLLAQQASAVTTSTLSFDPNTNCYSHANHNSHASHSSY